MENQQQNNTILTTAELIGQPQQTPQTNHSISVVQSFNRAMGLLPLLLPPSTSAAGIETVVSSTTNHYPMDTPLSSLATSASSVATAAVAGSFRGLSIAEVALAVEDISSDEDWPEEEDYFDFDDEEEDEPYPAWAEAEVTPASAPQPIPVIPGQTSEPGTGGAAGVTAVGQVESARQLRCKFFASRGVRASSAHAHAHLLRFRRKYGTVHWNDADMEEYQDYWGGPRYNNHSSMVQAKNLLNLYKSSCPHPNPATPSAAKPEVSDV